MMANKGWYKPAETVLLTGAEFTKTFGGYLGDEMWGAILNQPEISEDPILRRGYLEQPNFELFYHQTRSTGNYSDKQKASVDKAIVKAFEDMDTIISDSCRDDVNSGFAVCREFIAQFSGSREKRQRGFFFTLNQDLFIERFHTTDIELMCIPGLHKNWWFRADAHHPFDKDDFITVPHQNGVEKAKEQFMNKENPFVYVKLHGSYGWKSHDGSDEMVIGYEKEGMIGKEPLLEWYLCLFEEVLNDESVKNLLVIGYGFMDRHINKVIIGALKRGLRLHVVSPEPPQTFHKRLQSIHGFNRQYIEAGDRLWKGLYGYYTGKVTDFYSNTNWMTTRLGQTLFQNLGLR